MALFGRRRRDGVAQQRLQHLFGQEADGGNGDAVADGIWNAKCNGRDNVRFMRSDTVRFIRSAISRGEKYDVVFVDPPRSGCSREFLSKLAALAPKRIVYISCNPETLARDLAVLIGKYKVKRISPFDMFPFTNHIESVVQLIRN